MPSLTESIEVTASGLVVGATDWCTHPAGLAVPRVGGTKNPRSDDIADLSPDVVIANEEENRAVDIAALRERGLPVWVTAPRTLPGALESLDRMLTVCCRLDRPSWLEAAAAEWSGPSSGPRMTAVVPIWRRPWMVLGADTFAGDLLSRLGIDNLFARAAERYPKVELAEMRAHQPDLVVLPDEPYPFDWEDGPDAFAGLPSKVACVSGRHLTWYGPSLVEARRVLRDEIAHSKECSGAG